jgi:NADH-quinone oxidoreductase subunit J
VSIHTIFFFILAAISVISALLMITRPNPMHSALFLIMNFISLAGLYLLLSAQFIAIIQIVVYAGAIMVLVLFVIMLLNLQDEDRLRLTLGWKQYLGMLFAVVFIAEIAYLFLFRNPGALTAVSPNAKELGTVEHIGSSMFTSFLFPFELTSILLLAAIIGAVLLAKKRFP